MEYITIPGFTELTRQEMFDISVRHIGNTKQQSVIMGEGFATCVYSGSGCNAAPFIREECRTMADNIDKPDSVHKAPDASWLSLVNIGLVPNSNAQFIAMIQDAHDSIKAEHDSEGVLMPVKGETFMRKYDTNMRKIAMNKKLNTTALDALGWNHL